MRMPGLRWPLLAATLLALSARETNAAEIYYLESAAWVPTASVLTYPTSYVVASSYVFPTAYLAPTSFYSTATIVESVAPTTYLVPTYYETRFRRRGLFGLPLFARSRVYDLPLTDYYPTTYFVPTTYYAPTAFMTSRVVDSGVFAAEYVDSSTSCCAQVAMATPPPSRSYGYVERPAASAPRPVERPRQPKVESEPLDDAGISSDVDNVPENRAVQPPPERRVPQEAPVRPKGQPARQAEPGGTGDSPPIPPLPPRQSPANQPSPAQTKGAGATGSGGPSASREAGTAPATKSSTRVTMPPPVEVPPPVAPADNGELIPAPGEEGSTPGPTRRESRRPVLGAREVRSDYRNILFGKVLDRDSKDPEEGVRITLTHRSGAFEQREALSDAFGRFAVKLPDGDWTVRVAMPSGRTYSVSQLTVSNGVITDDLGRDIPSLIITR